MSPAKGVDATAKATTKKPAATTAKLPATDLRADVDAHLDDARPGNRELIDAIRSAIRTAARGLKEQWKWNAPSFSARDHIVTLNLRRPGEVMLVFHHPAVVHIESDLLAGDYPDRRLASVTSFEDLAGKRAELQRIVALLAGM